MNPRKIDLHTHTTASDGVLSPTELVHLAAEVGIGTLAITDHDTVAALPEATAAAEPLGIRIIPGVEFGADLNGSEVHLLGYFFDPTHAELLQKLAELREGRLDRTRAILSRLEALGVRVPYERVREIAGEGAVGRPHIAQALVELGHGSTIDEVFDLYLGHGRPAFVPRTGITPQGCIELVHRAGGVASLAHPTWIAGTDNLIPALVDAGLDGLETYYGSYDEETVEWLEGIAKRYKLIPTGGTDFHGHAGLAHATLGSRSLPPWCLRELERRATTRRKTRLENA